MNDTCFLFSNINVNIQKTQIDSFLIEFDNKKHLLKHIRTNNSCNNLIQDGFYEMEILLARDRNEHVEGLNGSHEMEMLLDKELIKSFTVKKLIFTK